jgi:hypothetical protein
MLHRASSALRRGISSSTARHWDEVRPHIHAGDHRNALLGLPHTVSIIGAPMTCALNEFPRQLLLLPPLTIVELI